MGRKMKDSGVEWIGEIPEDWQINKLKYVADFEPSSREKESKLDEEDLITYTPMECIKNGKFDNRSIAYGKVSTSLTRFQEGDICIAKVTPCFENGNIAIMENLYNGFGMGSSELFVIRPKEINKKYLFYWLMNQDFIQHGCATMTGTGGLKRVDSRYVKKTYLHYPSCSEQEKIGRYLDEKCSEIDKNISDNYKSIECYKSLKQSLITRAVTKGVRGRREMKESGIEWIGHCPSDWELRPFRYILKERQEKNFPIKSKERLSLSIDLGVTLYAEKTTNLDRFKDDFEQYKLAYPGDLVMNSMNMIVGASGVSDYFGCVSPVYYTFYDDTDNHVTAKFCEYIFRSRAMMRVLFSMGKGIYAIVRGDDRVNTCRLKVSKEDLKSLKLPLPSLDEQQEIVTYLDKKLSDIDTLIVKKEQLVSELENYKKSLIYEYVTGKREVLA